MVKLWLECRKWHIEHMYFKRIWGGGMPPHPPSRPGTPSTPPGAQILRTRSKPTDFLNQKVGMYNLGLDVSAFRVWEKFPLYPSV